MSAGVEQQGLVADVQRLLDSLTGCGDPAIESSAVLASDRLGQPLRVAVAGRLKAGKSTLINALVGSPIAATDATECTTHVTVYRHGETIGAAAVNHSGAVTPLRYVLTESNARVEGAIPEDTVRLEVTVPLDILSELTIVDTPGIASISSDVSARSIDYIGDDDRPDDPDVVVYLLRHVQEHDVRFLSALEEIRPGYDDPLRVMGILSRADELGAGRGDALGIASAMATSIGNRGDVRSIMGSLHPVAGLLAIAAATLSEKQFEQLTVLATADGATASHMTRSARSFVEGDGHIAVSSTERQQLLGILGIFGVRTCLALLSMAAVDSLEELRAHLEAASGLVPIRATLLTRFAGRADVLRAGRAVGSIQRIADGCSDPVLRDRVLLDLDEIKANAHELDELQWLRELQIRPELLRDPDDTDTIVSILGGNGTSPQARLGVGGVLATGELLTECQQRLNQLADIPVRPRGRKLIDAAHRSLEVLHHELIQG